MTENEVRMVLRLPEDVKEKLDELAAADMRSLNSEVLWLISLEWAKRQELPRFLVDREQTLPDYAETLLPVDGRQ